jgi:hypothetical protein
MESKTARVRRIPLVEAHRHVSLGAPLTDLLLRYYYGTQRGSKGVLSDLVKMEWKHEIREVLLATNRLINLLTIDYFWREAHR